MKAVVDEGPFSVAVEEVPDPRIEHQSDVVVRVTSMAICGSDLHISEGRTAAEPGLVFGHENLGIVEEVGSAVVSVTHGDRVVMPFDIACGIRKNRIGGYTGFCRSVNPGHESGREEPAIVLNSPIETVRATGALGVPVLHVLADPGTPDEAARQGRLLVAVGKFEKGLRMGTGQTKRQALRPPAARPDHGRPGRPALRGLPRASSRAGARVL
jgi:NADPH:quinone reductase-like Zn-dependent oxidoreductase